MPNPIGPVGLTARGKALLAQLTAQKHVSSNPAAQHEWHIAVPMLPWSPGNRSSPQPDERQRDRR